MTERLSLPREDRDIYVDFRELLDDYGAAPVDAARRLGTTLDIMNAITKADERNAYRRLARCANV